MKKLLSLVLLLASLVSAQAEENIDLHKNDYKWMQINLMQSINNKIPFGAQNDTYLELEFGGESGIFDYYGYLDVFDAFHSSDSDRHDTSDNAQDNLFLKFAPRMSLNKAFDADLTYGPIKELYIASVLEIGDKKLNVRFIGIGSDVDLPFLGTIGLNAYARYNIENFGAAEGKWDGYRVSTNWFTPFYFLKNKSFISYQGYIDYDFAMNELAKGENRTDSSLQFFNGIYWHSDRYSVGYGLKYYETFTGWKNNKEAGETTGFGHYLALTYKF